MKLIYDPLQCSYIFMDGDKSVRCGNSQFVFYADLSMIVKAYLIKNSIREDSKYTSTSEVKLIFEFKTNNELRDKFAEYLI